MSDPIAKSNAFVPIQGSRPQAAAGALKQPGEDFKSLYAKELEGAAPGAAGKSDPFVGIRGAGRPTDPMGVLKRSCEDFESLFVKQMLETARAGQTEDGLFGSETGSEVLWDMHNTYLSQSISRSQSLGVARLLLDQLKPLAQAGAQTAPQGLAIGPKVSSDESL